MIPCQPIEKSSDDEDSSEDDDDEDDGKEFNLGRFCAARVQVFHRFSHWEVSSLLLNNRARSHHEMKYTLFEAIKSELDHLQGGKLGDVSRARDGHFLPRKGFGAT